MTKPFIFISYSPENNQEKDQLLTQLNVLKGAGLIELWSDDEISPGADWEEEKLKAITQADIAILLISANFLTPDNFIFDTEVPEILKRYEQGELVIIPVIARACAWEKVEWLRTMEVRPRDHVPIWGNYTKDIDQELTNITNEVAQIVTSTSETDVTERFDAEITITNLIERAKEDIIPATAAFDNIKTAANNITDNWNKLPSQLKQAQTSKEKDEIIINMASITRGYTHTISGERPIIANLLSTSITAFTVSFNLLGEFNILDQQIAYEVIEKFEVVRDFKLVLMKFDNAIQDVLIGVTQFPDRPPVLEDAKRYLIAVLEYQKNDIPKILNRISELEKAMQNLADTSNSS